MFVKFGAWKAMGVAFLLIIPPTETYNIGALFEGFTAELVISANSSGKNPRQAI